MNNVGVKAGIQKLNHQNFFSDINALVSLKNTFIPLSHKITLK